MISLFHSRLRLALVVGVIGVLCAIPTICLSATFTKELAPGVTLTQEILPPNPDARIINVVSVDIANPNVSLGAALGKDRVYVDDANKGKETISSITGRTGALVGVNADYFPMEWVGDPLGVCVINGELVSEPRGNRAAMAVTADKRVFFDIPKYEAALTLADGRKEPVFGINRGRDTGKIVLLTDTFGDSTLMKYAGTDVILSSSSLPVRIGKDVAFTVTEVRPNALDSAIPKGGAILSGGGPSAQFLKDNLHVGDTVSVRFDVQSPSGKDWSNVQCAVGGGPWLVSNNAEYIDWQAEGWQSSFSSARHPRTAIGLTKDNKLLIVTLDGRQPMSSGASLPEMAAVLQRYGAVDAINLDGGGSTALSVLGMVVNSPSEFTERPVADALLVYAQRAVAEEVSGLTVTGVNDTVLSGNPYVLGLAATASVDQPAIAIDPARIVWGTTGGVGFVDQGGTYMPMRARTGSVCGVYGMEWATKKLSVLGGVADKVQVTLTESGGDPSIAELSAKATDAYGNPAPARPFAIRVFGGTVDTPVGTTDSKGTISGLVTWDAYAKGQNLCVVVDKANATVKREATVKPKPAVETAPALPPAEMKP